MYTEQEDKELQEKEEKNAVIAKFLGYTFKKGEFYTPDGYSGSYLVNEEVWWDETNYPLEHGLDFDSNWNSLMTAIDAIENLGFNTKIEKSDNYYYKDSFYWCSIGIDQWYGSSSVEGSKIDAVFMAVYKFCLEHNEKNKNDE